MGKKHCENSLTDQTSKKNFKLQDGQETLQKIFDHCQKNLKTQNDQETSKKIFDHYQKNLKTQNDQETLHKLSKKFLHKIVHLPLESLSIPMVRSGQFLCKNFFANIYK